MGGISSASLRTARSSQSGVGIGTARIGVAAALVCTTALAPKTSVQAQSGGVVISELHYHPDDDDPSTEFLEIFNRSGSAIDIGRWCVDGIGDYCFPSGTRIAANGFHVVRGDQYPGALSNGGEDIALIDAGGAVVEAFEYDDKDEWPALADGEGDSLQRRDVHSPVDDPGNWVSAPPSPGAHNPRRGRGLLPTFTDVEHTHHPGGGQGVVVTAELHNASSADLVYRIGFAPPRVTPMTRHGDTVTATIPGQAAGTLIRYRLRALEDGRRGTWPRQGDGSNFAGTTVRRSVDTDLPIFEFFMEDATHAAMIDDLTLHGDDGYPMVFAYDGQVFDNARVRVKGQVSRGFPKKKLKFILPPGYDLEADLFPDDVDEWAMHSAWPDRSFLRETLSSEFMTAANARGAQQAFPVRLERNGRFYGLYSYVEQPDGTYRDRYDYDDSEVYEVGPDNIFGTLHWSDSTKSQAALRARYDKETFEYLDDGRLRNFIATVNGLSGVAERDWIDGHVDIPSIVNILAASMVIQNQDWGHKNYRLIFDEYGRVGIAQNDYDLTFGRRWSNTAGALDTNVYVGGAFEHPGGPFLLTFFTDPELSAMVRRRVRTLTDELLNPAVLHPRVRELASLVRGDAVRDRAVWGTYGGAADPTTEANRINDQFVTPQYQRLVGSFARQVRVAPTPQPAIPAVAIESVRYSGVENVVVRNLSADTVDISSFEIPELDMVVPGGAVLLPGRSAIFLHEDAPTTAARYRDHLVAGFFDESVLDADRGVTLRNRSGAKVADWTLIPPRRQTEFRGDAHRSALVGLVSVRAAGRGHLQVLDCGDRAGGTSNLNTDSAGQVRAGIALTRFADDGTACIYNHTAAHLVADIQGYLADDAIDDIDDRRLLDTRHNRTPGAGSTTTVAGGRPGATGIVNLVAVNTATPGHVSVVPCSSRGTPTTSNLNWPNRGTTIATTAFVEFDGNGEFCLWTHSRTNLVVDLQGYVDPEAFDDVDDRRLLDTRCNSRPAARSSVEFAGRPNSTGVVSVVAVNPTAAGHLQIHACDATAGATSNVNYDAAGATIAALATVNFDDTGAACVYTHASADVVVDLQGYFADGAFDNIVDSRVLDTRE